ncbi:hypothetical protein [Candidatus Laterigemmans baculatus]|uniref:hypothetical protein n=1 Tax=Candidatus Laterigemmans baculatus TaxID=2770505 RepID=UPI0013DABDA7|nr:hypothetical protein [Candidatus Laterigemmans baculatus]
MKSKCRLHLLLLPLLAVTVALTGCGPSGPNYVPVKGVVTIDGKPLGLKTVFFAPEPGTPGMGAGASTDENGAFELLAVAAGATEDVYGALPGSYVVTVNEPMFPLGEEIAVQGEGDEPEVALGIPAPVRGGPKTIPAIYTSPEMTPLKIQIPEGGGDFKLELVSQ